MESSDEIRIEEESYSRPDKESPLRMPVTSFPGRKLPEGGKTVESALSRHVGSHGAR